jgi:HECT-domain (ubiquitin-transferase)
MCSPHARPALHPWQQSQTAARLRYQVCVARMQEFRAGFYSVASGSALVLFNPHELELLVCGLPHLDFAALQKAATYEGARPGAAPRAAHACHHFCSLCWQVCWRPDMCRS